MENFERCAWAATEPCLTYHDTEWGVPVHDDRRLFEMLTLEGAQAGLSWETVLKKREGYRKAFADFDPRAVAQFTPADVERLMLEPGIVRNRLKILSTINNAARVLETQEREGSFDRLIWSFVDGKTIDSAADPETSLPAATELSKRLSKDLVKRGFKFVGPTICYAFMQAAGLVDDHATNCFRYGLYRSTRIWFKLEI